MSKIYVGVDPGAGGALAVYDKGQNKLLFAENLAYVTEVVNRKERKRLDWDALDRQFVTAAVLGATECIIEDVSGVVGQSASASFTFGFTTCMCHASARRACLNVHKIRPQDWKPKLRVPGKTKMPAAQYTDIIVGRADELFPDCTKMFRGPRGGKLLDVAEAALIAYAWAHFIGD